MKRHLFLFLVLLTHIVFPMEEPKIEPFRLEDVDDANTKKQPKTFNRNASPLRELEEMIEGLSDYPLPKEKTEPKPQDSLLQFFALQYALKEENYPKNLQTFILAPLFKTAFASALTDYCAQIDTKEQNALLSRAIKPKSTVLFEAKNIISNLMYLQNRKAFLCTEGDTLQLWDLHDRKKPVLVCDHGAWVHTIAYAFDGKNTIAKKEIISGAIDGTIKLWNSNTGERIATVAAHKSAINCFLYRPDKQELISGSSDKLIKIWNLKTQELLKTLSGHTGAINCLAACPDKDEFASAGTEGIIRVWNTYEKDSTRILEGHKDSLYCLAYLSKEMLASGGRDNTIKLWNTTTGKELQTLIGQKSTVSSLFFLPKRKQLVSAGTNQTINIWNTTTGELQHSFSGHQAAINRLDYVPEEESIISASNDKTIRMWSLKTIDAANELLKNPNDRQHLYFCMLKVAHDAGLKTEVKELSKMSQIMVSNKQLADSIEQLGKK